MDLTKRFWDKVNKTSDCWNWTGCRLKTGYGQIRINGKLQYTHRVAWEFMNGTIPSGKVIMHKCDNPSCVNHSHLICGTQKENIQDCVKKDRKPRGSEIYFSKLTLKGVKEIRRLYSLKLKKQCELAEIYEVTQSVISKIILNKIWVDI